MIGTDEMSSTGMDISESFRAEDLSKTDFFDFVTAPEMGIGIGVSLHTHHHHHHHHERTTATHLTNNGGSGDVGGVGSDDVTMDGGNTNGNTGDPTLHAYDQFWNTDKDHSRLDSTIFEDLDRYCWQQHQQQQQQLHPPSQSHAPALNNPSSPSQHLRTAINVTLNNASSSTSSGNLPSSGSSSSGVSQPGSAGTNTSSIENTDGQIYTITVLNGNEPWLKREPDTQLPSSLDLDSLLGNFPGYIKSEYPYDDSGFSTDGTKDNGDGSGVNMPQLSASQHHGMSGVVIPPSGQSLPSLVTALSVATGAAVGGTATGIVGQQFSQFQNNNNDWQMADNNAEQNSAESLLRSALQGKGYSKGLHIQNGLSLLPTSPSIKNDDMRRMLFSSDADALAFADSTLNTSQIFDDNQNSAHNPHNVLQQQHATTPSGPQSGSNTSSSAAANVASIIVDDMFLSLESAFSDDFEKIKRIANEVQQFCSSTPIVSDYPGSDVLMQLSPTNMQPMQSPATTPLGGVPPTATQLIQQVTHPPPPQPLKPEVTTSTSSRLPVTPTTAKSNKKYKRSASTTTASLATAGSNNSAMSQSSSSNGNSNNKTGNGCNASSTNNNGSSGGSNSSSTSSSSPTHCNGQRKERSLHYCSICSKGFKDKYSVNVHIRTHTGEKPFACSLCGKSFRQKAHLAKHYQTHMAQKSNGSLVKSGAAKNHRTAPTMNSGSMTSNVTSLAVNSAVATQQRQLNVVSSAVAVNGPTTVLPPVNGLIANR